MVSQIHFNKKTDGSLLDMFESPLFDVHMLMRYLHSLNRANLLQYLMNKLWKEHRNDTSILDFYLPQLCYLTITKRSREVSLPIERFLLQICVKYQVLGLKALQWFSAWMTDESMPYAERANDMYSQIEAANVNGELPSRYHQDLLKKEQHEKEMRESSYKEYTGMTTSRGDKKQAENSAEQRIEPKPKDKENRTGGYVIEGEDMARPETSPVEQEKKEQVQVWPMNQSEEQID